MGARRPNHGATEMRGPKAYLKVISAGQTVPGQAVRLLGLFVPFFRLCGSPCVVVSSTCRPFRPIYAESQPHHTKRLSSLQHLHTLGSCPSCSLGQSSPQLPSGCVPLCQVPMLPSTFSCFCTLQQLRHSVLMSPQGSPGGPGLQDLAHHFFCRDQYSF